MQGSAQLGFYSVMCETNRRRAISLLRNGVNMSTLSPTLPKA